MPARGRNAIIDSTDTQMRLAARCRVAQTTRTLLVALLGTVALCQFGCATSRWVNVREQPNNPLTARLNLLSRGGPKPTERTEQLLRRYDLVDDLKGNPREMMTKLHQITLQEPSLENMYAMAELAYLGAKKTESRDQTAALDLYGAAVMHAYFYLFDPRFDTVRNPYDPQYRGASEIYNTALEGALRIVQKSDALRPGCTHTIRMAGLEMDVTVVVRSPGWRDEDFDSFEFVSDYETKGLSNHYVDHGLGVPLIALRGKRNQDESAEEFYPPGLSFPVSAFLRMVGQQPSAVAGAPGRLKATLELYDPLVVSDIQVADRMVPLETDLTTPLAYFLGQPQFNDSDLSTLGLLRPDRAAGLRGLYMLEPFQADKVPVVMVHGLWSSPVTWMQMYNDLRADPEVRRNYQFWFYMYPTGQPFWLSARQMRQDMALARAKLDPYQHHPALGQSVLIGHSMGGLISRMQSVDPGDAFWRIVSDEPISAVKAEPETYQVLQATFFPKPDMAVRRVITIGTPHGGSHFANNVTRWFGNKLISLPRKFLSRRQQLLRDNPGVFHEQAIFAANTSIDSLSPESPLLPVLRTQPPAPWIHHHNIVGRVPTDGFLGWVSNEGDGVVSLASANLEVAESQIAVPADHSTVHQHPRAILEVRRILLDHLRELRAGYVAYPVQPATASVWPRSGTPAPNAYPPEAIAP
ncbi:MAG: hypothetical protein KDA42_15705 [Planctomycetales bacterium]|nr:hypothetical protein [Planctomycetales bacterium]